ncbi:MAG: hypothetical protein AABX48_02125 [Nanoarchaeota archaeon]
MTNIVMPLEKILTISATEYCNMMNKNLQDYIPRGVYGGDPEKLSCPKETEVVVAYQKSSCASGGNYFSSGMGTALIPRKE